MKLDGKLGDAGALAGDWAFSEYNGTFQAARPTAVPAAAPAAAPGASSGSGNRSQAPVICGFERRDCSRGDLSGMPEPAANCGRLGIL